MKRYGVIALIAVLVLGFGVYFAACSGGGGGSSPQGPQPVSYATSTQAAAGVKSVTGAMSLSSTVGSMASGVAGGAVPSGYAPARRAKAADTSAIANIDPRLKTVVDKMAADINNSTIKNTISKARSLKAISNAPISSATVTCGYSGSFTISGSDSSTATASIFDITVTYTDCQDVSGTTYDVLNGTLHAVVNDKLDGTSRNDNLTATNLALASYSSGTLLSTDALNGTFASVYSVGTNSVTTSSDSANASFSITLNNGAIYTFNMNNVSGVDVYTPGTTANTEDFTANGSFVFDISSNGTSVASINLSFTNLEDKQQYNADQSEDEWINGTLSLTWTPSAGGDCMPGQITIGTAAATPMHYAYTAGIGLASCPSSGTVTANNATIEFGNPSGTYVTVTVGTNTPQVFTDCNFDGAGNMCISQPVM